MPRTYKNLYPQIYDFDNLYLAWRRARRGGKRKWPAVAAFEFDLERNLWELHDELQAQTYQPGPYRHFTIYEPKVRRISAAPFGDRVVHHALMQVTWPIFEARMIHDSYACRVGKGLRYCDDFLLFADDKATLWAWRAALVARLARLRLTLHPGAHLRPVTEGLPFLGFVVYPDRRALKRRKGVAFARRFRALYAAWQAGEIPLARLTAAAQGWANHARYGETWALRRAILGWRPD